MPCHRFVRTRRADIFTRAQTRVYQPVYTKGRVIHTEEEQPDQSNFTEGQQRNGSASPTPQPLFFRTRPFGWYPSFDIATLIGEEVVDENELEEEGEDEEEEEEDQEEMEEREGSQGENNPFMVRFLRLGEAWWGEERMGGLMATV